MIPARILIVDDDQILCEELADIFQDEGFVVEYVLAPHIGVERLTQCHYDVLILDYKMPDLNGIQFLLLSRDKLAGMKIFIMSGSLKIDKMLKEHDLSSMVTGIFVKPFSLKALLAGIKSAMSS